LEIKQLVDTNTYNTLKQFSKNLVSLKIEIRFLCYHSVTHSEDLPRVVHTPTITENAFRRQMRQIEKMGFKAISVEQSFQLLQAKESPGKYVCITFDDGYLDNWTIAWPILKQMGYPAHFFITSDWIGQKFEKHINGSPIKVECMNEQMLFDLAQQNASIGSHGKTHCDLTKIDPGQVVIELQESKRKLKAIVGHDINFFSYPYSFYDTRTIKELERAGYNSAFTIETRGFHKLHSRDKYRMSRIVIKGNEDDELFKLKICGGFDWTYWYTVFKRRISITLRK